MVGIKFKDIINNNNYKWIKLKDKYCKVKGWKYI